MPSETVKKNNVLWEPDQKVLETANIAAFMRWLQPEKGLSFNAYADLWQWSVDEIEVFWESLWEYYQIKASSPYDQVLQERKMPGAKWFSGAKLNYAEHVFRNMSTERPALIFQSEIQPLMEISWNELYNHVSAMAAGLHHLGVERGDRVVSLMPNIPQTIVAFLACASLGAIWSSCSPDFGMRSITDRFKQIQPKVLFVVDGYQYGGKAFERSKENAALQEALTSLEATILVPYLDADAAVGNLKETHLWPDLVSRKAELVFEQVPFDHPIWVVYSSGTTGLPKPLVHSQGGILLEFYKFLGLHMDLKPQDRFFWFSTTGWVMWNIMQGGLLTGATSLLYDGNPGFPDMDVLWDFAEKSQMTVFGTSAAYLTACMNSGIEPGAAHDLSRLRIVGSTGSPLSPEGFRWVYEKVNQDVLLGSVSGGTDPCSAFVACCPLLPVKVGELQCRGLGVNAQAFDPEGNALVDEVGELVITEPMPSMPLYLWNDDGDERYQSSYFDMYPGKWRHGDWVKFTDEGAGIILGRSDSTINRFGVRMGSSEIYAAVEELPEIVDSLVVGYTDPAGNYCMPLFVVLEKSFLLDDALKSKIAKNIREALSPRHVPDEIHAIDEVPCTLNGKKLEVPVIKILSGIPLEKAVNVDSMSNPQAIDYFVKLAG
ncbi:MAG: acetoacetate--CoA ligase [Thermodesulfobacteriota bacterium]